MILGKWFKLVKESVSAWIDDYAPSMGAALAYYTIFSIAPLLIIVIAVAGIFFGQEAVRGELASQLGDLLGTEGAQAVQGLIASASTPKSGVIATVVGVFILILGATSVFGELQSALDRIWRAPAAPKTAGIWKLLRTRLLSFGLVLGIGFLLLGVARQSARRSPRSARGRRERWESGNGCSNSSTSCCRLRSKPACSP
jgi:membrane protein